MVGGTLDAMPYHRIENPDALRRLMEATLLVQSDLRLPVVLRHVVGEAAALADARYGALGVIAPDGERLEQFVTVGIADDTARGIGPPPTGRGVLGVALRHPHPIRLADLRRHPAAVGFPPGHPAMVTFLGVPVRVREEVYGTLYLTEKQGAAEFTDEDEDLVSALAVAAGFAVENARLHERLRTLTLVEDRDRIARDLHDTVIQRLFAVGLSLQGTARVADQEDVAGRLAEAIDQLDETIRQVRTTIFDLEVAPLQAGFRRAVLDLLEELAPVLGATPQLVFDGPVEHAVTAGTADDVLAVLREALSNVARHAAADRVSVAVSTRAGSVTVTVTDDGRGIAEGAGGGGTGSAGRRSGGGGLGLHNLGQRAAKRGGTLTVGAGDGGGTRLVWTVPQEDTGGSGSGVGFNA